MAPLGRLLSAVLLTAGITSSVSQSVPKTVDSTWNLYNGPDTNVQFTVKTTRYPGTPSRFGGQSYANFEFTISLGANLEGLQGLSLELINENMFCATGTQSNCLPLPSDPSYPANQLYEHQSSRKFVLLFGNPSLTSAFICRYALMNEFCQTKSECDNLGWTSADTMMSEMKAKAKSGGDNFQFLSNGNEYQITYGLKTASGKKVTYVYNFDIPDQFFGMGSNDPTYSLGFDTGATRYLAFGAWMKSLTSFDSKSKMCPNSPSSTGDNSFYQLFDNQFYLSSVFPWTNDREDQFSGHFVEFPVPTAAPTYKPTAKPTTASPTKKPTTGKPTKQPTTGKPTKAPTTAPTKKPTTPIPSKAPTTPKPTNAPTDFPTKKPTLAPTLFPSKAPTTGKPTKSPTPGPTAAPVQFFCPNVRNQELCQRINTWFQHFSDDVSRRMKNVERECIANGCHWCSYPVDGTPLGQCRPKYPETNPQYKVYTYEQACPKDRTDPYEDCDMFPDCPPPEEMTACRELNTLPGYKRNLCENGFSLEIGGKVFTVGAKRCAYNKGICRAVGDYFWARKTFFRLPGYFDLRRGCAYEAVPN